MPTTKKKTSKPRTIRVTEPEVAAPTAPASEPRVRRAPVKLPPAPRLVVRASRMQKRIAHLVKTVSRWNNAPEVRTALIAARDSFDKALDVVRELPSTFVPLKGSTSSEDVGGRRLQAGDVVCIREKARAGYADILDADEFEGLVVIAMKGRTRVLLKTGDGVRIIIPRGHIVAAAVPADAAHEEEPEDESPDSELDEEEGDA